MGNQPHSIIEDILNAARWTPSGDNMQTWRFEIIDSRHFVVHGYDTRDHCVYDLQGHASQLALGALQESIAIAASHYGYRAQFQLRADSPETKPTIDVTIAEDVNISPDPLFAFLPIRSVQRRPLKTTPLSAQQKAALEQAVGGAYSVRWVEGLGNRWQAAKLMFMNGKLRLTLPEAFRTHSTVIEWNAQFSDDKIPDQAVGLDPMATRLMQWAMHSWQRVAFLNTYLSGTVLPGLELDVLPSLGCAAHFALVANSQAQNIQDYFNAGRALQRFWLTVTQLNLQLQPEMTPLIFSGYIRDNVTFTQQAPLVSYATKITQRFEQVFGKDETTRAVFVGRVGSGDPASARSLRLSVAQLLTAKA